MQFEVVLSNQAQYEIDLSYLFYFEIESILGELDIAFDVLSYNPYFQPFKENIKTFPLDIFPYILFFEIYNETKIVRILSVFHTSQNPIKYP